MQKPDTLKKMKLAYGQLYNITTLKICSNNTVAFGNTCPYNCIILSRNILKRMSIMNEKRAKRVIYVILILIATLLDVSYMLDSGNKGLSDLINIAASYLTILAIVLSLNSQGWKELRERLDRIIEILEKKEH